MTGVVPRKPRDPHRHAFFAEEFGPAEPAPLPGGPAPDPNKPNKYVDDTVSATFKNPFGATPAAPNDNYYLYAKSGFVPKERDPFFLTILFGHGDEMNRFGLRAIFAAAPANAVLITVPGVEDTGSGSSPVGITKDIIHQLLKLRFVGKKVFVDDKGAERDPTDSDYSIRVMAAFRNGGLGLLECFAQRASIGYPELATNRLVFFDALTKGLDGGKLEKELKALLGRASRLRAISYFATASGSVRLAAIQKVFGSFSREIDVRNAAQPNFRTLVLRRLLANGIADGFFSTEQAEAVCKPLLNLPLPNRGTVAGHTLFRDRPNPTSTEWASSNAGDLSKVTTAHKQAALDLVVANVLTGHPPPKNPADAKHPFEVLDDQFVAEFAGECLIAPHPPRGTTIPRDNPFFEDEFGAGPTSYRTNKFTALTETLAIPDPLDAVEFAAGAGAKRHITDYFIHLPSPPAVGSSLKITLLFAVGPEMNRHGLRFYASGKANAAFIVISGIERGWSDSGGKAWGKSIDRATINELLKMALATSVQFKDEIKGIDLTDSFADKWTVEVLAGYSTGYHGVVATTCCAFDSPDPKDPPRAAKLDLDLSKLKQVVFYDCFYFRDQAAKGRQMRDAIKRIEKLTSAHVYAYRMTSGGNSVGALPMVTNLGVRGRVIDRFAAASHLRAIYYARMMKNAVADGFFSRNRVPAGMIALMDLLPARGALASDASVLTDPLAHPRMAKAQPVLDFVKAHATEIAQAQAALEASHILVDWFNLAGWNTSPGEMDHDGHPPEFAGEYLMS